MPGTIVLAGCLLLFAADAAGAQLTGQLAGVVRDTSGGLLPGATVTVTGRIVVAPRTVVTNDRGRYELDNLPADRYLIEVSQSRIFFSPFNDAIETQKAYGLLHLRAGVGPRHRRWEIAVYARNVANTEYLTGTSSGGAPAIVGRAGEPRQWGTQFTIRQ